MKKDSLEARIAKVQEDVRVRIKELKPIIQEAERLNEILEIVEYAIKERDELRARLAKKTGTKSNVDKWAATLDFDEIVRAQDLATAFDGKYNWARNHIIRLEEEGVLEKWGKGAWRRKPERTGQATLRVMTG